MRKKREKGGGIEWEVGTGEGDGRKGKGRTF